MKHNDLVKVKNKSAVGNVSDADNMAEVVSSYKGIVIISPAINGVDTFGAEELELI